jgi:hypothetical protein
MDVRKYIVNINKKEEDTTSSTPSNTSNNEEDLMDLDDNEL